VSCEGLPFSATVQTSEALAFGRLNEIIFDPEGLCGWKKPLNGSSTKMVMTKAELVEDVAKAAELTKKDAERLVEIVFESIIDTLNQGEKIELRGFGSFRVRERGARRGRNPKTGDPVNIPAKRVPYFKPGKELKELINEEHAPAQSAATDTPAATSTDDDTQPPAL
jgi:integration host factor subunit beta